MNTQEISEEWGQRLYRRMFEKDIKDLAKGSKIAVMGGGIAALWVEQICQEYEHTVEVFVDDYPQNSIVTGKVISMRELTDMKTDAIFVTAMLNSSKIVSRLRSSGYNGQICAPLQVETSQPAFELSKAPKNLNGLPGRDWPLNVQIQSQSACNALCAMCPYPISYNNDNPGKMTDELFNKIINDLAHYRLGKLCMYLQNEPFLDRRWFDWVERATKELSFQRFEVSTNLSPLNEKNVLKLIEILKKVPHEVWLSFHGIDKESYEKVMGLNFERSLKNLETFCRAAHEHGLRYRIHGFGEPLDRKKKGGNFFSKEQYLEFFENFQKEKNLPKLNVQFYKYHDRAGTISDDLSFNFRLKDLSKRYCHRVDTWLHIRYDGEIIFCCDDYHRETVIGNIGRQTIMEFFRSEPYRNMRDMALGIKESPDDFICKRCLKPGG